MKTTKIQLMATQQKNKSGKKLSSAQLYGLIDQYISTQGNKTFNYRQVAHAVGAATPALQKAE
ncbi:MAG: hypothetical protein K2N91_06205, partial [Muribaculaceae bacterium]|nr:hypothetical protein [Muribaculaceae bacterium]